MVGFTKEGEILVGQVAKRQAVTTPRHRLLDQTVHGRRYHEVREEITLAPYRVAKALNGDVRVEIRGKQDSPPEISAMILRKLKEAAEAYLGETVNQAVIDRPGLLQRQPASGDERRGDDRWPGGPTDYQRATAAALRCTGGQEEG